MFERDPEEIGPEAYEDTELRLDTIESIHTFDPDENGRCRGHLIRHGARGVRCNSTQRSSVFHDDPEADFRAMHDHGGGDCMCFESEDGPSYYEAMRRFAYPTREEIAEEKDELVRRSRRTRRVIALSQGKVITRIGQSITPDDPRLQQKWDRAMKLHRWGVTR